MTKCLYSLSKWTTREEARPQAHTDTGQTKAFRRVRTHEHHELEAAEEVDQMRRIRWILDEDSELNAGGHKGREVGKTELTKPGRNLLTEDFRTE